VRKSSRESTPETAHCHFKMDGIETITVLSREQRNGKEGTLYYSVLIHALVVHFFHSFENTIIIHTSALDVVVIHNLESSDDLQ